MIPELSFYNPSTVEQAVDMLCKNPGMRVLAGGTDVISGIRSGSSRFRNVTGLVDINGIESMRAISETDDSVSIGAAVTFAEITDSAICKSHYPALISAASQVGSPQIRNRATIAGNFVNNAPCADSVPSLLVYDASISIATADGEYEIPLRDFLVKPYQTKIGDASLVTRVTLKKYPSTYHGSFYKLGRRRAVVISRMTISLLGEEKAGAIADMRVAIGAATPIGKRVPEVEEFLNGKQINDDLFREAGVMLGTHLLQATGLRWSTPYKLPVAQNLCYQQLSKLFSR